MQIGILGGTFDPIHEGHLALARAAVKQLHLDVLYFVPAHQSPLKEYAQAAPSEHRYKMVELAISEMHEFKISDFEIRRPQKSYSIDTIRHFREKFPKPHELYFITGGDWAQDLSKWKNIDEIFKLCHFVVAKRPGYETMKLPKPVQFLEFVPLHVSATEIRKLLKEKCYNVPQLPTSVINYILNHRLYLGK